MRYSDTPLSRWTPVTTQGHLINHHSANSLIKLQRIHLLMDRYIDTYVSTSFTNIFCTKLPTCSSRKISRFCGLYDV